MAVLSNKPHGYTVEIVKTLFPQNIFSQVLGHRDGYPKKPDPTTAHQIISVIGILKPKEVAYIGDSTVDLATARNGDMTATYFFLGLWHTRPTSLSWTRLMI